MKKLNLGTLTTVLSFLSYLQKNNWVRYISKDEQGNINLLQVNLNKKEDSED